MITFAQKLNFDEMVDDDRVGVRKWGDKEREIKME